MPPSDGRRDDHPDHGGHRGRGGSPDRGHGPSGGHGRCGRDRRPSNLQKIGRRHGAARSSVPPHTEDASNSPDATGSGRRQDTSIHQPRRSLDPVRQAAREAPEAAVARRFECRPKVEREPTRRTPASVPGVRGAMPTV